MRQCEVFIKGKYCGLMTESDDRIYIFQYDQEYLNCAKIMCLYHHEKWDGTGYPYGIKGTDIPLSARIMAAADVLDALLSKRQYKEPMSIDEAMDIFMESRGKHFEPCIVDAVLMSKDRIMEIANE